MHKTKQEIPKL